MFSKINRFFTLLWPKKSPEQLFSYKTILTFCVILIGILALTTGFYHASLVAEQKKYLRLEDRYVRVREQLGREATQDLIDASYK
mgnify:CR=1 FL=1